MDLDRRLFIASLGGAAAVAAMDSEARAEALEEALTARVAPAPSPSGKFPTVAEVAARIPTRNYRRGVGVIFAAQALGSVYDPVPPPEKVPVLKRNPGHESGDTIPISVVKSSAVELGVVIGWTAPAARKRKWLPSHRPGFIVVRR